MFLELFPKFFENFIWKFNEEQMKGFPFETCKDVVLRKEVLEPAQKI